VSRATGMRHACRCVVAGFVLFVMPAATLAQSTTQVVEYYTTDPAGSVRAVTKQVNGQWQVVARYDYMPFGEETPPQAPTPYHRLFTGKDRDRETAQDYFGARYYRADLGRFTTIDPAMTIKENLVDPQRWNRYAYVTNNPLKYTDPDGKNPLLIAGGIGAAVYGGFAIYQNVRSGAPNWYDNVGVEATKGLLVGLTLGAAGAALAPASAVEAVNLGPTAGRVVIGSFPQYVELAEQLGAKYFSIKPEIWQKMSDAERLAANNKFLDRAIVRGDTFVLTMSVKDALQRGGVWLRHEIQYLMSRGYSVASDGRSLVPPE